MPFKVEFGNERLITPTGLGLAGMLLQKTQLKERVDVIKLKNTQRPKLQNSDIIVPYIGLLCQGKSNFECVNEMHDDADFFTYALGINRLPSDARLRQRMDQLGNRLESIIAQENVRLLNSVGTILTPCFEDYIPLDVDVSPFDNSNTKKEGVSWTYKKFDGYAPIFAYLGEEGYLIHSELRAGSTHCQNGTADFLKETIHLSKQLTNKRLLLRMDSGNDSKDNLAVCGAKETNCDFLIKRNLRKENNRTWQVIAEEDSSTVCTRPRKGKRVLTGSVYWRVDGCEEKVRVIYKVTERTSLANGQLLMIPEISVETYWTSLICSETTAIHLYHAHGTSEQFHSEIKTDMDLERFPSKYFATNQLVLQLAMIAYNILRIIGQTSLKVNPSKKVQRKRLKTVIKNFITIAARIVTHSRQRYIKLGRSNHWRYCFKQVYDSLL